RIGIYGAKICRLQAELWKKYVKDKDIDWPEYSILYIEEIKGNPQAIQLLQILSFFVNDRNHRKKPHIQLQQEQLKIYDLIQKHRTVTLLCHCKNEKLCHRSIVKDMIYSDFNLK
ncbi:MAG TPA: hypothetical protein VIR31_07335, partial [Nitrososphaeraceae archaeon]